MNKHTFLPLLAFTLPLVSCQPPNPYEGPPVPLSQALISISEGMRAADRASGSGKSTGLIPAKATVAFNVVNTSTSEQGVTLNVVPVPGLTTGGTLGKTYTQQGTSAITVEYSSYLLAGTNSVIGGMTNDERKKLLDEITTLRNKNLLTEKENLRLKLNIEKLDERLDTLENSPGE